MIIIAEGQNIDIINSCSWDHFDSCFSDCGCDEND